MTDMTIKLTGGLITAALADGLYAWAGDTTGEPADKFVDAALDAYEGIIEQVTGGTWRRSYSELTVPADTELPEGWQDEIGERIEELDLGPIFEGVTQA